jgi:hypothetical protein
MITKPAIQWLNSDSDSLLVNDICVIMLALTNNATIYAAPTPAFPVVQTALDNFSAGLAATADGGPSATVKKNNLRLVLAALVRQLASHVTVACKGDMANLILSGFPVQKPVCTPIGALPAPQNLVITHGVISGELDAKVNPVFGAATYTWICTAATAGAVPIPGISTAASYAFSGLTRGVSYIPSRPMRWARPAQATGATRSARLPSKPNPESFDLPERAGAIPARSWFPAAVADGK